MAAALKSTPPSPTVLEVAVDDEKVPTVGATIGATAVDVTPKLKPVDG